MDIMSIDQVCNNTGYSTCEYPQYIMGIYMPYVVIGLCILTLVFLIFFTLWVDRKMGVG